MSTSFPHVTILVPGTILHEHAVRRIDEQFRLVKIDRADPALLTPELARTVRGVAGAMITIDAAFMKALPALEIIAYFGMGYETIDIRQALWQGVMVTNTPDLMNEEVADVALGLLLMTLRELEKAQAWLRAGHWKTKGNYPLTRGTLRGRRVGIFGLGRIGRAIARRLEAFGVDIAYHNRTRNSELPYDYYPTLGELAARVDTLISVAPSSPSTDKAIDAEVLRRLGPEGVVINVGRGSTIDQDALVAALSDGTILGAGLDVFASEPDVPQALVSLPNAVLLPHVASASQKTRREVADLCVDNLVSWFSNGSPLTPVPEISNQ